MAVHTDIQWADSSLNTMMGCDGCELWNPKTGVQHCYAGSLTQRYGGRNGWPVNFETPKLFLDRLDKALKWPDLTGTNRDDKPWFNGARRHIFLNDMGDTFTESLPLDWLAQPYGKQNRSSLELMAESKHVFMLLTKRPSRMAAFSELHPLPANVWPGCSITSQATVSRVDHLFRVQGGGPKWLSVEPLLGPVDLPTMQGLALVVIGGESHQGKARARPCATSWIRSIIRQCREANVKVFVKQLGSAPDGLALKDAHGGDMNEWPEDLRIREMP